MKIEGLPVIHVGRGRHFTHATSQREEQDYADNNCARQHSDYGALMAG